MKTCSDYLWCVRPLALRVSEGYVGWWGLWGGKKRGLRASESVVGWGFVVGLSKTVMWCSGGDWLGLLRGIDEGNGD